MLPYEYSRLSAEAQEIRLVTLLPGEFNDAVRFTLSQTPLIMPDERPPERMPLKALRDTLPPGWGVYETLEGRFIFEHEETEDTSWTHPASSFDRALYDPPSEGPYPGFRPMYEALSYMWGPTDNPETAYVETSANPFPSSGTIPATLQLGQNLASAMRHLRYPAKARVLWIDAVCINQKDDIERSEQVGRMANIYKSAHRVMVWLGPEAGNSKLAISTLRYLGVQVEVTRDYSFLRSPQCTEPNWFQDWCKLPYDEETWHALHNLVERSWFERLWIWQEVQLGNCRAMMQCGHDKIPWTDLRRAALCLYDNTHLPSPQFREQITRLSSLALNQLRNTMCDLLSLTRGLKCSDPKDKVYGLLGIAPPIVASKIRPQYSLSVAAVYKDMFLVYLDQVHRLDLLQHCNLAGRQIEAPSWVPDWSVSRKSGEITGWQFASGVSCARARHLPQDVLEVTGVQCATIRTVSQTAPQDFQGVLDLIRDCEPVNLQTSSYITGESLLDAYVSTFRFNWLKDRVPVQGRVTLQVWKELFLTEISASGGPIKADCINDIYVRTPLDFVRGRTFVTTEEGYIGLGPQGVRPGDLVCVILGCNAPMLLRLRSSGKFQVVGECYVHGLMDSESLLGLLPDSWKVRIDAADDGIHYTRYSNSLTGVVTVEDPRLDPLPLEWERIQADRTPDDPAVFARFRNRITGEVMHSDPRLLPEALKQRGVDLKTFQLV